MHHLQGIPTGLGYLNASKPILVVVDEYSGYKTVWELRDSKSLTVIRALREFFFNFGFPIQIRNDG